MYIARQASCDIVIFGMEMWAIFQYYEPWGGRKKEGNMKTYEKYISKQLTRLGYR